MESWFAMRNVDPPWGDYGDVLVSGMASRREDGSIDLERAGPFVPPITLVGSDILVVTDRFRRELHTAGLVGLRYREVRKKKVVRVDSRDWDPTSEPAVYPPEAEPENYIARRRHSSALADEIGPLWEVVIVPAPGGADLVRSPSGEILASETARRWFLLHAADWLCFERR